MRSPPKFSNDNLTSGVTLLPMPAISVNTTRDMKQTRSLSRGRPSTANNNLI